MSAYRYVILGGGMVAGYAAKEFVELGLKPGELSIVSSDDALPYERPPLSKGFLAGREDEASTLINDEAFYRQHGVDVRLRTVVEHLDANGKRLWTSSGEEICFESLVVATGARLRVLDLPGAGLDGILYLRSLDDSKRIKAQAEQARRAVVIGSGFIGMEVASVLAQQGLETAMIFPEDRIWQRLFTPEISTFFERYYRQRGVILLPATMLAGFEGEGHVSAVLLAEGSTLPADIVVAGIGVEPALEALNGAGLHLDGGVEVNEYLETNIAGIYAAGDIARYHDTLFGKWRRLEHWDNAVEQGKHVAHGVMGDRKPFVHVPYFFSDVFDLSYEFWGDTDGADQVVYRGDVEDGRFSAWWLREGRLLAAFVLNRPEEERELAPMWIAERRQLSSAHIREARSLR